MSASKVFVDANGLIALLNDRERLHRPASAVWRELLRDKRPLVFTDWIVAETGNGLARTAARQAFSKTVARLRASPRVEVIFVGAERFASALELYAKRSDKTWGLVDCASFAVMKEDGIEDAFTTDRHCEQAGFKCLLPAKG